MSGFSSSLELSPIFLKLTTSFQDIQIVVCTQRHSHMLHLLMSSIPLFQLHMCILMFLIMFATSGLHATEQGIHYLRHIAILQDRSNLSPIKDRGVCYGTIFSLNISIYIPILLVPINDILKTDSVLKPNSVLNILKTNSVPTNILYINLPRTQKMSS